MGHEKGVIGVDGEGKDQGRSGAGKVWGMRGA